MDAAGLRGRAVAACPRHFPDTRMSTQHSSVFAPSCDGFTPWVRRCAATGAGPARAAAGALLVAAAVASALPSFAQGYPTRPIRLIVAYPPGGTSDVVARPVAQRLGELLGQSVVVDNRGGASGNIGTELAARAAPDGYVLSLAAGAVTIAPSIYPNLPYDIVRDFAPISLVARGGFALLVHPTVPARSVKEVIDLARARPGALNYASAGVGAPPYLSAVLFQTMTRTRLTHVPYKGGSQPLTDLAAGQVDVYFGGIASAAPFMQSGRVRPIAVTTKKRWPTLPELPTFDESGLPGFDISTWFGLMAPAGTPAEIIARLHAATVKAVESPTLRKTLLTAGAAPETCTPAEFAALVKSEIGKFAAIVKSAGVKAD